MIGGVPKRLYFTVQMVTNKLKEYREKAGISQTELSWRSRINAQNISAIECGRVAPWPKARKALAKALKIQEPRLFPEIDGGKASS